MKNRPHAISAPAWRPSDCEIAAAIAARDASGASRAMRALLGLFPDAVTFFLSPSLALEVACDDRS
jgi:DNA-binding GntR family transcriptional regulator